MQTNNKTHPTQNKRVFFDETSTYTVDLKNAKDKRNIAVVSRTFAPDGHESIDKILERWIRAIDLND